MKGRLLNCIEIFRIKKMSFRNRWIKRMRKVRKNNSRLMMRNRRKRKLNSFSIMKMEREL